MKKVKLIIVVLVITIITSSCWSRREIENLGFVLGLGVGKTEKGLYTVVVQVANPKKILAEAPDQREIYTIMKSEGLTIFDALRNLSMLSGRRLYLSHIKSLIIDEAIAKEGITEVIGFLLQDMEVRLEIDVFISKLPPEEIFDTPNTVGIIPAMALDIAARNYGANSKINVADLHKSVEAANNPYINFSTVLIEKLPSPTDKEKPMNKLTQIAVFDSVNLVGYLDYEEGQGYNFITNKFKNGLIVFTSNLSGERITIEILDSKADIKPNYVDGRIGFDISLSVSGNIAERVPEKNKPMETDIEVVTAQLNKVIEDKIRKALNASQYRLEVDSFNLSSYFHRSFPKEFNEIKDNWNKVFTNVDINIKVESSVIHTALNQNKGRI